MNRLNLVALALLTTSPLSAQQAVPGAQPDTAAGSCGWRPRCSTPGVTFALKESKRMKVSGNTVILYDLPHSGFPPDKVFTLWTWGIDVPPRVMYTGFTADASGALVCGDAKKLSASAESNAPWCEGPLSNVSPAAGGFTSSEPFRMALIATDKTVAAYALSYPFPVEATDGRCRLMLELVSHKPPTFALHAEGFEPGETLQMVFRSGDEEIPHSLQVPGDGAFTEVIVPGVKGKRGGSAT